VNIARTVIRQVPIECSLNSTALQPACRAGIVKNLAILEVYFMDSSYALYTETPGYPVSVPYDSIQLLPLVQFTSCLADTGGQLGIIVGMSVFSVAEIVIMIIQVILTLIAGRAQA
jgi:hypothetical protein